jgi:hypothetical protein
MSQQELKDAVALAHAKLAEAQSRRMEFEKPIFGLRGLGGEWWSEVELRRALATANIKPSVAEEIVSIRAAEKAAREAHRVAKLRLANG